MLYFYYVLVVVLSFAAAVNYVRGGVADACFFLIALGIILVLNEIKRNARIYNSYSDCTFNSFTPDIVSRSSEKEISDAEKGR